MSEPTYKELVEKYTSAWEELSNEAMDAFLDKVKEAVNNYLLNFGDPEGYAGFRDFGRVLTQALLAWFLAEGYVVIHRDHVATEAQKVERRQELEEKRARFHDRPKDVPFQTAYL